MKNEKVILVSLHQAVKIDGALATTLSDAGSRGKYRADMVLKPELQCILAETANDRVLIPFTNCAAIRLESEASIKKEKDISAAEEKAKKGKTRAEIKRPR